MKQHWKKLTLRIDALQLRERVFLFLAVIVCALALADTLWLAPAQEAHKLATVRYAAQSVDLQRLRDELKAVAQPVDPSKLVREEIAATDARLELLNQEIRAVAPMAEGGPAIEQTLVQFLRRQSGLTLVRTGTLAADPATPEQAGDAGQLFTRRGLELNVAGSYADLVRYVRTLEGALPTLRWGTLQLKASDDKPTMNLQVYVVGAAP